MSVLDGFENKMQMLKENFCTKLVFEGMEIDVSKRMIYRENKEVKATCVEFQILHLLARNPGRVFSKEQIYDIVWKEPYVGDYNIVMSHIRNIREKIEDDPQNPVYIQTWGYAGNAGNLLVISHGNGLLTYYMHCNAIYVSAGQKVSRGQNVAAVGTAVRRRTGD